MSVAGIVVAATSGLIALGGVVAASPVGVASRVAVTAASASALPQVGSSILERGIRLLEDNDVEGAIAELRVAVRLAPADPVARYHLGRALFAGGYSAEAVPQLEAAMGATNDAGPVHFLLGQVYIEVGRLAEAKAALEAARETRPDYPPIDYYLAEVCYRAGHAEAAATRWEAVVAAAPDWPAPLVRLGVSALVLGEPAVAADRFREAIAQAEAQASLWMRLGGALAAAQEHDAALEAYREAVRRSPDFVPARFALSSELFVLRDYDGAFEQFSAVLERAPQHGVARLQRAEVLALRGERETALEELERALVDLAGHAIDPGEGGEATGPQRVRAAELRAELLMQLGRMEAAESAARALVERNPRSTKGHFVLGTVLVRKGDEAGERHLRTFKALTDASEQRELADHYRNDLDDTERARAAYHAALEADPTDPGSLLGLGALQRRAGEIDAAVESLEAARAGGRDDGGWYREWILTLLDAGRREEALSAWEEIRSSGELLDPEVWSRVYEGRVECD